MPALGRSGGWSAPDDLTGPARTKTPHGKAQCKTQRDRTTGHGADARCGQRLDFVKAARVESNRCDKGG